MKELQDRILKDGKVFPGEILKVDSFLNHQIDPMLMEDISEEFYRLFKEDRVTKVLTIEASGIAIAVMVARRFGVPLVFAKKSRTKNIAGSLYKTRVTSYTHGGEYDVVVSRDFLCPGDRVLIIDDFLALGEASKGLIRLTEMAGGTVAGVGIAIEKGFQPGGAWLREHGYHLESLAIVEEMSDDGTIVFRRD